MAELITNGTPSDLNALQGWNAFKAQVKTDPGYGFIFEITYQGYMTQFAEVSGVLNTLTFTIEYKNSGDDTKGSIVLYDSDDNNVNSVFILGTTDGYQTISYDIKTDDEVKVARLGFEVLNNTPGNIQVASISLNGSIQSDVTPENTSDFMQSCIMFGLDAAKPDLR